MVMNKSFLIPFVYCLSSLLFGQWDQLLLPRDDHRYAQVENLSRESGTPLFPGGTYRPWSYRSLKDQLNRINYAHLSRESQKLFREIKDTMELEGFYHEPLLSMDTGLILNPALFHDFTVTGSPAGPEKLEYDRKKRPPLLILPFRFSFYGDFIMEAEYRLVEETIKEERESNVMNLPLDVYDVDWNVPQRAYAAYGRDNWSLLLGRVQNDWGHGITGNSFLSDSLIYHDSLRARASWDRFAFGFLLVTLENRLTPDQEEKLEALNPGVNYHDNRAMGGKYLLAHSFDVLLGKGLHIGFTEGLILGGYDFVFTHSYLNPITLYHNYFLNVGYQGNAIHQLEIDYTWPNHLLYLQIVLDQFQASSEVESGSPDAPFTFGVIGGIKNTRTLGDDVLNWGAEAVWMTPYLYTNTYGVYYGSATGNEYHLSGHLNLPLGYGEGPDRMVLSLWSEWRVKQSLWEAEIRGTWRGPVTAADDYPWKPLDGTDRYRMIPSWEDEKEIRLDLGYSRSLAEDLNLTLWASPFFLWDRLDGRKNAFVLETGLSLGYTL